MQFDEVFKRSNIIDRQMRVKFDPFDYLKAKLGPVVNLGCLVFHGGYLKSKLKLLALIFKKYVDRNFVQGTKEYTDSYIYIY